MRALAAGCFAASSPVVPPRRRRRRGRRRRPPFRRQAAAQRHSHRSSKVAAPTPVSQAAAASPAAVTGPETAAVAARFPDPPCATPRPPSRRPAGLHQQRGAAVAAARAWCASQRAGRPAGQAAVAGLSQTGQPIEALLLRRRPTCRRPPLRSLRPADRAADRPAARRRARRRRGPAGGGTGAVAGPAGTAAGAAERGACCRAPTPTARSAAARATASGIDINRDHLLLRTPEAQAHRRLVRDYQPLVVADAHEYPARAATATSSAPWPRARSCCCSTRRRPTSPSSSRARPKEWFRQPLLASLQREGLSSRLVPPAVRDRRRAARADGRHAPGHGPQRARAAPRGQPAGRVARRRPRPHAPARARAHARWWRWTACCRAPRHAQTTCARLRRFVDTEVGRQACRGEDVARGRRHAERIRAAAARPGRPAPTSRSACLGLLAAAAGR